MSGRLKNPEGNPKILLRRSWIRMTYERKFMNIIFFGTPHFVIPVLQSLIEHFEVVAVVSTPDVPLDRKKILTPTPVKQFAIEKNIATIITDQQWSNVTIQQLSKLHADLFVTADYGRIIPENILQIPRLGSLNIHPSLLPKYRGTSPIQSAILNGDKETGVTIIEMDKKLDHGPILAQEQVILKGDETFESLHTSLFQKAAEILPKAVEDYSNKTIIPTPQDDTKATWCKKITKEDGYFDIENPPSKEKLDSMIRAYYPWPTAWTLLHSESFGEQGKILKLLPEKRVQLEGGNAMRLKDFLNGYPHLAKILSPLF